MQIEGTIVAVLPLEHGVSKTSGNPWSKATIVVETIGQYPKKVALSNMKNAEEFAKLPIGTQGVFKIDVESREYNGRWYSDIRCYAYEIGGTQQQQPQYAQPQAPQPVYTQPTQPQTNQYAPSPQQGYAQPRQPQGDDSLPF